MGFLGFKTVSEFERLVVFGMSGRFAGIRGPGLVFVSPGQRIAARIDLRETIRNMPDQHCLTKDSVVVIVDPIVFYKIVDPEKTALSIRDAEAGILNLARTTLRAVVGELELPDIVGDRERIAGQLKQRLAIEAGRWGIDRDRRFEAST